MTAPFHAYVPPGETVARFLACDERIRALIGPIGSGKTGGGLMDPIYRAMRQTPHPADKVRRTKWATIRDSYRQLEKTTIKSWHRWFPQDMPGSHWVGGTGGQPATHTLEFRLPDGTLVHTVMEFIGLGEHSAEAVMPGWEGTGGYLNEVDKMTRDTVTYVRSRVGRYPAVDQAIGFAGADWWGLWMDFNKTDVDHWLYDFLFENPAEGVAVFDQPPAMLKAPDGRYVVNPRAENLQNLPKGYYEGQIAGQPEWFIRRMILNQWGASRDGAPVYPEFTDAVHVAPRPLKPVAGLPLRIGADAGLKAAAVILQQMPNGQWRGLDELVAPATGWGAQRFGAALVQLLAERYGPWLELLRKMGGPNVPRAESPIVGTGDPWGNARGGNDERTWLSIVQAVTGIPFLPAPTNNITPRLEAVRRPLTRMIDGEPGLLISPTMKVIRKGFNSGYRLKKVLKAGREVYETTPDKDTPYADPHDALQYDLLDGGEFRALMAAHRGDGQAGRHQVEAITEDNPRGTWTGGADDGQAFAIVDDD